MCRHIACQDGTAGTWLQTDTADLSGLLWTPRRGTLWLPGLPSALCAGGEATRAAANAAHTQAARKILKIFLYIFLFIYLTFVRRL